MGAKVMHYVGHEYNHVRKDDRICVCETPSGTMRFPNTHNLTEVTCIRCLQQLERWARKAGDKKAASDLDIEIIRRRLDNYHNRKQRFRARLSSWTA